MKTDLYTKVMLTVIASCLLYLCFLSKVPTAQAAGEPPCGFPGLPPCPAATNVVITGVALPGGIGLPVVPQSAFPVYVQDGVVLPVGILHTQGIEDMNGKRTWTNLPVPVQVKP
jgi:hypothetical protein